MLNHLPRLEVKVFNPEQTTDIYGNHILTEDWSTPSFITRGVLQQDTSVELASVSRSAVNSGFKLFIFDNVEISSQSKIEIDGRGYTVEAEPHIPLSSSGFSYMVVAIKRMVG